MLFRSTTNSVTVDFSSLSVSGNISVYGHSPCGDGTASSLFITVNLIPANAGPISGPTTVCQGQNSVVYSVPVIANATSYIWSLPAGATGSSNTNSITVNYSLSAMTGNITVKGNNSCGDGGISTLPINVKEKPVTPIITYNGSVLHSNALTGNQWYNQNGLINGATSQNYVPVINGIYYVIVSINGCSSDPSNSINIVTIGIEQTEFNKLIKVYPNPCVNELVIEFIGNKDIISFEIFKSMGQIVFKGNLLEKTVIKTINYNSGLYFIKIENGVSYIIKEFIKE